MEFAGVYPEAAPKDEANTQIRAYAAGEIILVVIGILI
jgi:hypothetical protein